MQYLNNYPCVFLHGYLGWGENDKFDRHIPYWGFGSKNLMKHLRQEGYEVYHPSLGPVNGAWDRVCILWAYLFGGRVDYGAAHSRRHHHARYGKTFSRGVLEDLGTPGAHRKINLLGHSFGGAAVKQAAELFAHGSAEERAATPPEELSPLFAGGHGSLLHTCTTLSGVNNGSVIASKFRQAAVTFCVYWILMFNTMVGTTHFMKRFNFMTQQWGIMPEPEDLRWYRFRLPIQRLHGVHAYNSNRGEDNLAHEMQIDVVQEEINPKQHIDPGIYYFAQRAVKTKRGLFGIERPELTMHPLCFWWAFPNAHILSHRLDRYGVHQTEAWSMNDGFVNLAGCSAPLNAPQENGAIGETNFYPGRWYNMPVVHADHLFWNGMSGRRKQYFAFYDTVLELYRLLPDGVGEGQTEKWNTEKWETTHPRPA